MPGIRCKEPMYGFPNSWATSIAPPPSNQPTIRFNHYATKDWKMFDPPDAVVSRLALQNPLWGNFVVRERVHSSASLASFTPAGQVDNVLWVNFHTNRKFDSALERRLRQLFTDLCARQTAIVTALDTSDPFPVHILTGILQATQGLSIRDIDNQRYLTEVLQAVVAAVGLTSASGDFAGFASVLKYDPRLKQLDRISASRSLQGTQGSFPVTAGRGLTLWSALRKRALLVKDINTSPFRDLYIPVSPTTRSELVVPMLAGDEVIGVLNLESDAAECPFSPSLARALWCVATQVAIAFHLADAQSQSRRFLTILQEAATTAASQPETSWLQSLNVATDLGRFACESLGAQDSVLWYYPTDSDPVSFGTGATNLHLKTPRHSTGFSAWIMKTRHVLWLGSIKSLDRFDAMVWHNDAWRDVGPNAPQLPTLLNTQDPDITSHIGLPIEVGKQCLGVLWLVFNAFELGSPPPSFVSRSRWFASLAGHAIDVVQHQKDIAKDQALRPFARTLRQKMFPCREEPGFPSTELELLGLEAYVIYEPHEGEIGGDFFDLTVLKDEERVVILVGDAQHHGLEAALRMLPIIGAFKMISQESGSAKHILQKLAALPDDVGLNATAMCVMLEKHRDKTGTHWHLFVSNAGHPSLLRVRRNGNIDEVSESQHVGDLSNRGGFGLNLDTPLGEGHLDLEEGDLIVAYTDGVSEAGLKTSADESDDEQPPAAHKTATNRLLGFRRPVTSITPKQLAEEIRSEALARDHGVLGDDMTIMVFRILPERGTTL